MDWDEAQARSESVIALGQSLEDLSVAELEARLAALARETTRVNAELEIKKAQAAAAEALFKS